MLNVPLNLVIFYMFFPTGYQRVPADGGELSAELI